jgi:hypothetical protein
MRTCPSTEPCWQPKAPLRYLVTIALPGLLSGWGALLQFASVRAGPAMGIRGAFAAGARLVDRFRNGRRRWANHGPGTDAGAPRLPTPRLAIAAAVAALWVGLLFFPEATSGRYLDQDWGLTLGYLMKTRSQAGVDYVFTYGPLGYLTDPLFYPGLFGLKYLWTIAFAAASAVALVRFATLLSSRLLQVSWLWLMLAFLPRTEMHVVVVLVVIALLHVLEDAWSPRRLAATAALFATLGLVKFTFLLLATGLVVTLAVAGPRGARSRIGGTLAGCYLVSLASLWLLAGQSLSHVPRYLATSFEIARGYSEGMSFDGGPKLRAAAFQVMVAVAIGAVLVPPRAWRSRHRMAGLAIVALGLFLSWKEGFVRQDPPHTAVFFAYAAIATVMLAALEGGRDEATLPLRAAFLAVAALESVGVLRGIAKEPPSRMLSLALTRDRAARSVEILWSPLRHRDAGEGAWHTQEKAWALPAVQARVGRDSLDTMTIDQGVVLLNGFNWHPRPIFQSYSAYTPKLARLNGEFFRREDGPRFVLMRWASIDLRFPADDDGPALIEVLRRYRPALWEQDYVLLQRLPPAEVRSGPGSTIVHRRLRFDERLRVSLDPKDLCTLSVSAKPTLVGKLRRLLFRSPKLIFLVEQPRERKRYELVPELASVPFVLSPLFEGNFDVPFVYSGRGRRIVAIRFVGTDELRAFFGNSVEITIRRYPGVVDAPSSP